MVILIMAYSRKNGHGTCSYGHCKRIVIITGQIKTRAPASHYQHDIESVIGNRYSEYRIKVALKALREKGILQTTGNGRSVRYSVNMSNAEGLGQIRLMMERLSELIRKQ